MFCLTKTENLFEAQQSSFKQWSIINSQWLVDRTEGAASIVAGCMRHRRGLFVPEAHLDNVSVDVRRCSVGRRRRRCCGRDEWHVGGCWRGRGERVVSRLGGTHCTACRVRGLAASWYENVVRPVRSSVGLTMIKFKLRKFMMHKLVNSVNTQLH